MLVVESIENHYTRSHIIECHQMRVDVENKKFQVEVIIASKIIATGHKLLDQMIFPVRGTLCLFSKIIKSQFFCPILSLPTFYSQCLNFSIFYSNFSKFNFAMNCYPCDERIQILQESSKKLSKLNQTRV